MVSIQRLTMIAFFILLVPQVALALSPFIYRGNLLDEKGEPVTGVFPLLISLTPTHADAEGDDWSEEHYISVVDGRYSVLLGKKQPLPPAFARATLLLKIELRGMGELVSEKVRLTAPTVSPELIKTLSTPGVVVEGYAEYAERSTTADQAEAVGEIPAKVITKRLKAFRAHEAKANAHHAKTILTDQAEFLEPVGGDGGDPFVRSCPRGYVVTGIKGRAGAMLDSIQVICTEMR